MSARPSTARVEGPGRAGRWPWKARAGFGLLAVLAVASAGWAALAARGAAPYCPFGPDVELATRTVCDRALGGLWISLVLGLVAGLAAVALALALALLARVRGGVVEQLVLRGAQLTFSIPDVLVLVLVAFGLEVVAAEGRAPLPPAVAMAVALVLVGWAAPAQVLHRRLAALEAMDFVTAARALGATRTRILVHHLLPFARDHVLALFLRAVPAAILAESTASFLGFGLPPREASLGTYLGTNFAALVRGEWRIIGPAWGLLLAAVVGFRWAGQAALEAAERREP